jgi:predicted secreted protein
MRRAALVVIVVLAFAGSAAAGTIVTVGPSADGTTVKLHVGDTLAVALPGNAGTGYHWVATDSDAMVLAAGPITYKSSKPNRPGAPGTYTLHFKAKAAGKAVLKLKYVPPGRNTHAVKTIELAALVSK